jgi:transcriptional regulator GlxA family with amidase domain
VLERRLSAAQHLLRQSKMLLADIAFKCGFSSQTHMNDVFRERLGVTPVQYRRDISQNLRNTALLQNVQRQNSSPPH